MSSNGIISLAVVLFHATCGTTVLLTLSYAAWYGEAPLELSSLKQRPQHQDVRSFEVVETSSKGRATYASADVGTTLGVNGGLDAGTSKRRAGSKVSGSVDSASCAQGCCETDWGGPYDTSLLECANSTTQSSPPTCAEGGKKDATQSPRVAVVTMITSKVSRRLILLSLW
eukprot:1194830-Prorocentrum_minimum.AAC.2